MIESRIERIETKKYKKCENGDKVEKWAETSAGECG
jgi:hypothetical protein